MTNCSTANIVIHYWHCRTLTWLRFIEQVAAGGEGGAGDGVTHARKPTGLSRVFQHASQESREGLPHQKWTNQILRSNPACVDAQLKSEEKVTVSAWMTARPTYVYY